MKKIAIVGSRDFENYGLLYHFMMYFYPFKLISGGARGTDSLAEKFAEEMNLKKKIYKPNWDKYGKRAAFIRNKKIVKNSDIVVAFWDGESRGTKMTIDLARELNKKLYIVTYPNV